MARRNEGVRDALKRQLRKLEIQYEKTPENATVKRAKIMKVAEKLEKRIDATKD